MTRETPERMPWCPECELIAVPDTGGVCGECGAAVVFREGEP
jgi:hypothetical protein